MGFIGKLFVGFLALVAVLGIVGFVLIRVRAAREGVSRQQAEEELLPKKADENVADLRDRFNRARYMDKDGGEAQ